MKDYHEKVVPLWKLGLIKYFIVKLFNKYIIQYIQASAGIFTGCQQLILSGNESNCYVKTMCRCDWFLKSFFKFFLFTRVFLLHKFVQTLLNLNKKVFLSTKV